MTSKLHTSFFEATRSVFQLMLDLTNIKDSPAEVFEAEDELYISIELVGDITGEVIYRFPKSTSLNFVNILSGMEIDGIDDFVVSAMSEISNIISGNVITMLAEDDLKCDIHPPQVCKREEYKAYTASISFCVSTSAGNACIDILLNQAN